MSTEAFESVVAEVRAQVDPDETERTHLQDVANEIITRTEATAAELPVEADVIQVGSTARGTWLSGDRDIDVFVRFPPDLPREKLKAYGLQIGHAVLPDGHEEFAEHPYVVGSVDGFDVDLVPCFRVPDATAIQSAVDRTPFHTQYLNDRLNEDLAAEVRVFKQFCKGIGVYGSDLRTCGLSGYLTELLVLEYGGFLEVLEAAADWQPQVELDPEDHGRATFKDPLVVIDPTDPERNVAAVTSAENVARLQHHARAFLEEPTVERFFPTDPEPLDADDVREHIERRGTTPVAIRFDAPDLVDDQLYPQLRKSLAGITRELGRRGFDVFRAATWSAASSVLFVELAVASRPAVERHDGPPVAVREHALGFYGKYQREDGITYGPFVDGDRYVVEREREFTTVHEFLESDALLDVSLGVHIEEALREEYEVLVGEESTALAEEFGVELANYFDPTV